MEGCGGGFGGNRGEVSGLKVGEVKVMGSDLTLRYQGLLFKRQPFINKIAMLFLIQSANNHLNKSSF